MIFARYSSHLSELAYTDVGNALFAVFLLCKLTINRENEKIKEKMPAGVRQMAAAWLVLNRKKGKTAVPTTETQTPSFTYVALRTDT